MPQNAALKMRAANQIHKALQNLEPHEQVQIVQGVLTLLGLSAEQVQQALVAVADVRSPAAAGAARSPGAGVKAVGTAREYFASKQPQGKMEDIAVASRYRELSSQADTHATADLETTFKAARRNFPTNFARDLRNAKKQGYFNKGKEVVLSAYGQEYVDALPDRAAARALQRPKAGGRGRPKKKKGAPKKS